jgi:hypothetical protein
MKLYGARVSGEPGDRLYTLVFTDRFGRRVFRSGKPRLTGDEKTAAERQAVVKTLFDELSAEFDNS